jgi:hypothetical protein
MAQATIDDVNAVLDSIPVFIDGIVADEAAQMVEIQALKDQVAAGSAVTAAQLQSVFDKSKAIKDRLEAVDLSQPVPVPVP